MNRASAIVELRWYFNAYEGEMGMRAMSLEPSGGEAGEAAGERRTTAFLRGRNVRAALDRMDPRGHVRRAQERVLLIAFGEAPPRDGWRGLERWNELAGVAALAVNRNDLIAGRNWLVRWLRTASAQEIERRRKGAQARLDEALNAFVNATPGKARRGE